MQVSLLYRKRSDLTCILLHVIAQPHENSLTLEHDILKNKVQVIPICCQRILKASLSHTQFHLNLDQE